ncbi:precorrin-2 dehydrogenase/sirohydrochlorin ferrochelatase family protein [Enterococcus wangshanyuanii]|uniref:precorrin-2 dehydrogenase n=1 Tax=Enterococcus wangshanyuanii TaxID=2005703 RepID=A0ABQ1P4A0_9ENTE|nr:bifunctional precorrin-2 dehydrogenase/sirohydrochlorin ferrochelatase [Enterococcus wangshanyuanii]GGC88775.1 uroporphyrin-III C-methyltransferase [Enterococcus wangshanyuanii]
MYPIMLDLTEKKIVIIGGGNIALRKTKAIIKAGGKVTIVAPAILPEFFELSAVQWIESTYESKYIKTAHLIFACTDSLSVNQQVVKDTAEWQWINDCSQKENSNFYNMSTIEQEDSLIALSSYGKDPAKLKEQRKKLETLLNHTIN